MNDIECDWRPNPIFLASVQRDWLILAKDHHNFSDRRIAFFRRVKGFILKCRDHRFVCDFKHSLSESFALVRRPDHGDLSKEQVEGERMREKHAGMLVCGFDLFLGRLHFSVSVGLVRASNVARRGGQDD